MRNTNNADEEKTISKSRVPFPNLEKKRYYLVGATFFCLFKELYGPISNIISVAGFQFVKVGGPTERLTKQYDTSPES